VRDDATLAVPRTALDVGTWLATDIVSFNLVPNGTFGRITAATLVLHIKMVSDGGSVSTAPLRLICNIDDRASRAVTQKGSYSTLTARRLGTSHH